MYFCYIRNASGLWVMSLCVFTAIAFYFSSFLLHMRWNSYRNQPPLLPLYQRHFSRWVHNFCCLFNQNFYSVSLKRRFTFDNFFPGESWPQAKIWAWKKRGRKFPPKKFLKRQKTKKWSKLHAGDDALFQGYIRKVYNFNLGRRCFKNMWKR